MSDEPPPVFAMVGRGAVLSAPSDGDAAAAEAGSTLDLGACSESERPAAAPRRFR